MPRPESIEQNYGLGNLGFADTRCAPSWAGNCAKDNLRGFFNYTQTPRTFRTIMSNRKAEDFINEKTPQPIPTTTKGS